MPKRPILICMFYFWVSRLTIHISLIHEQNTHFIRTPTKWNPKHIWIEIEETNAFKQTYSNEIEARVIEITWSICIIKAKANSFGVRCAAPTIESRKSISFLKYIQLASKMAVDYRVLTESIDWWGKFLRARARAGKKCVDFDLNFSSGLKCMFRCAVRGNEKHISHAFHTWNVHFWC